MVAARQCPTGRADKCALQARHTVQRFSGSLHAAAERMGGCSVLGSGGFAQCTERLRGRRTGGMAPSREAGRPTPTTLGPASGAGTPRGEHVGDGGERPRGSRRRPPRRKEQDGAEEVDDARESSAGTDGPCGARAQSAAVVVAAAAAGVGAGGVGGGGEDEASCSFFASLLSFCSCLDC